LNWQILLSNPWVQVVGGGVVVTFIGWVAKHLNKKTKEQEHLAGTAVQQNASPAMTQNFHPNINVHLSSPATIKTQFQTAQDQNAFTPQEAEEKRLLQLETNLYQLIFAVKIINAPTEDGCVHRLFSDLGDIRGFFSVHPEVQLLNLNAMKILFTYDLRGEVKDYTHSAWQHELKGQDDTASPCDAAISAMVEQLLTLRIRPNRTMKQFEQTLPQ